MFFNNLLLHNYISIADLAKCLVRNERTAGNKTKYRESDSSSQENKKEKQGEKPLTQLILNFSLPFDIFQKLIMNLLFSLLSSISLA